MRKVKSQNSTKLVAHPLSSNEYDARDEVNLIDIQSYPDGLYKFMLGSEMFANKTFAYYGK